MVTPAIMWRLLMRCCMARVAWASCTREFTPIASSASAVLKREHLAAVVSANFQHVGKIVLALSVVVRNARKRIEKRRRIKAVETRVAFRDSGFFGRGIFLLNNADHSFAFANNAAIPKRVVHMHGEHDHGRARLFALSDKGLNGFRSDKRAIARKNHERTLGDRAVGLRECLTTSVHGVARAELLGLNGDFRIALNKRKQPFRTYVRAR